MGKEHGIKETSEALTGLLRLTAVLASKFRDGVQASDAAAVWAKFESDPDFKAAILDAYNGADKVPQEIGDIDLAEGFTLGGVLLKEGQEVVVALVA